MTCFGFEAIRKISANVKEILADFLNVTDNTKASSVTLLSSFPCYEIEPASQQLIVVFLMNILHTGPLRLDPCLLHFSKSRSTVASCSGVNGDGHGRVEEDVDAFSGHDGFPGLQSFSQTN